MAVFVADVGGTNTRFALINNSSIIAHFSCKSTKSSFTTLVTEALTRFKGKKITAACIALATNISPKKTVHTLTNAHVMIRTKEVQNVFGTRKVTFINDFEAIAYGVLSLPKKSVVVLQKGKKSKKPILVLGAGTGLGVALLQWKNGAYQPIATEKGHTTFVPRTKQEEELAQFISSQKVEWEDLLSGRGIQRIYQFLTNSKKVRSPASIATGKSVACRETMVIFSDIYASCIQHFVTKEKTFGGVYIAGGIAAKNVGVFKRKAFKEKLIRDDRLKDVPVFVITDENAGLYGAGIAAYKKR